MQFFNFLTMGKSEIEEKIRKNSISEGCVFLFPAFDFDSNLLSKPDLERLNKISILEKRKIFVQGRHWLRLILSQITEIPPQELIFLKTPHGKLYLEFSNWDFSLAHSGNYLVLGFAPKKFIGVDIESKNKPSKEVELAKKFFAVNEIASVQQNQENFLKIWTAKEALVKSAGESLLLQMGKIDFDPAAERLISLPAELGSPQDFNFHYLLQDSEKILCVCLKTSPSAYRPYH